MYFIILINLGYLEIKAEETFKLSKAVSIKLNTINYPLSKNCSMTLWKDSLMLIIDPQYPNLFIYNTNTGNQDIIVKLSYNYETLVKKYISNNEDTAKFIIANRFQVSDSHYSEFSLQSLFTDGQNIFLTSRIGFSFPNKLDEDGVTVFYENFIIIIDYTLQNIDFVRLPYTLLMGGQVQGPFNTGIHFFVNKNENYFLFAMQDISQPSSNIPFLSKVKYNAQEKRFTSAEVLSCKLPKWFEENKMGYNYSNFQFFNNNEIYVYFNFLPFVCGLDGKIKLQIPDSSFYSQPKSIENNLSDCFFLGKISMTKKNEIAYLARSKKDVFYFAVLDPLSKQNEFKVDFEDLKIIKPNTNNIVLTDSKIYIIKIGKDEAELLNYNYLK